MTDKERLIDENCENAKEVASKIGFTIVCDDEEEQQEAVSTDENCENAKEIASKLGYQIVCDDE